MNSLSFALRTAGLSAGLAFLSVSVGAAETDAMPTFDSNYITFSAGGADLNGSKPAYQARTQSAKSGAAGIEDMRFDYDLKDKTTLTVTGRALAGQEDYLLNFKLSKDQVGSVEVGYKTFRTFYDGAGGFFPIGNVWMPLFSRALYVDRGQFSLSGTIALPKAPVFTFKYAHSTRDGRKDSTSWGDSNLTGIPIYAGPGAVNPIAAMRKLLPAYVDLDEKNDTWEISARHKVGNTTAVVSLGGNSIKNLNVREMYQNIGELAVFPAPVFTAPTVNNVRAGSPRRTTMTQRHEEDGYHASATFETKVDEKVTVFGGLVYHTADVDIATSRQLIATIASATGVRDYAGGFTNTGPTARAPYHLVAKGDLEYTVVTGNIGARFNPSKDVAIEAALRGERWKDSGKNLGNYSSQGVTLATGAVTSYASQGLHGVENVEKPWTPTLDFRYTGIKNMALYASWEYRTAKQDEHVRYEGLNGQTKANELDMIGKKIDETHSNATIGMSATVSPQLTLRAEVFTKDHENDFNGYDDVIGRNYVLNYDIYGGRLTAVIKPSNQVNLTSRYVLQRGKSTIFHSGLTTTGVLNGWVDGNDSTRHSFSEGITWSVSKAVYVQANGSVVYDQMQTMYPWISGIAKRNFRNADNNYVTGDATVGFSIDRNTTGMIQATYYRANNFDADYAAVGMPLGASGKDSTISLGVRYKIDDKTLLNAKVGYCDSENSTRGGFADFSGPLAYLSIQRAF
ncbi:MAG: hypothetical protein HZC55_17590 [Verrucomicrobia bacterium]|nr:hypothetical protein [Verrucomicrobiota bacterium]